MGCNSSLPPTTVAQPLHQAKGEKQRKPQPETVTKNGPTTPADQTAKKLPAEPVAAAPMNTNKKHIMLSYQHANQELVLKVYKFLQKHRVAVWMDIKGGMEEHLLDSMAAAVQNSAAVVCFLTQKYQDSQNCKDEFKYARKKDKPIIPCLITLGWKPDGWLDIGISDLLYIDFKKTTEENFEQKCEELLEKIKQVVKLDDIFITEDGIPAGFEEDGVDAELQEELNYEGFNVDCTSKMVPNIHEGPEIKIVNIDQTQINKHTCEGDSVVRLLLTGKGKDRNIQANQDSFRHDGEFLNYFFIPKLVFHNKSKQPISIIELSGEYEDSHGNWCECHDIKLSPALSENDENYNWLPNTTLNLEPLKLTTFAVRVDVKVKGTPGSSNKHRMRAHKSLPQPFKIRLTLQDTEGKTASLIVEQANEQFVLPTKEIAMKTFDFEDIVAFVYADDCDGDERYWVVIYYEDKSKLRFSFGYGLNGYETKYLDTWLIKDFCNQAKKTAATEIVLDEWNHDWRTITALFDKETFILFGFRIELKTDTSKTRETVLLPLDKLRERLAIEKLEPDDDRIVNTYTSIS
ncbi:unnamed protein product [Rotaria socialis]|uniref:TIR domain-containing protein n=4 Tax=Rotaria socialis TaxID=392032 RepID=A0A817TJZ5_9BILA|nr:unnamed protein product [Rotaria socialis]